MKTRTILGAAVIGASLILGSIKASAAEPTVQQILDGMTVGPVAGVSHAALIPEGNDGLWSIGGSGGSFQVLFTRNAGDANSFGIYDGSDSAKTVQVFSGTDPVGTSSLVTMDILGNVKVNNVLVATFAGNRFGFYMNNGLGQGNFFSQTGLNGDGYDHMWAYQGNGSDQIQLTPSSPVGTWGANEFALFWEDTLGGGDGDHNDMGVFAESVTPLPDGGMTLALLGFAIVGVESIRRKLSK